MERPKKKKITNALNAQQSFECIGFNRACDKFKVWLPDMNEISNIIEKLDLCCELAPSDFYSIAKAISKRLRGEK